MLLEHVNDVHTCFLGGRDHDLTGCVRGKVDHFLEINIAKRVNGLKEQY